MSEEEKGNAKILSRESKKDDSVREEGWGGEGFIPAGRENSDSMGLLRTIPGGGMVIVL